MAVYALGFMGGEEAAKALRERLQSDEDRYVRYNAAVALGRRGDMAAKGTLSEMLSSSDLDRLIELAGLTEKQNKIEAIELEALAGRRLLPCRQRIARAGPCAPPPDRRPDALGPGGCSEPGSGGFAKITTRDLMKYSSRPHDGPVRLSTTTMSILSIPRVNQGFERCLPGRAERAESDRGARCAVRCRLSAVSLDFANLM